MEFYQLTPLDVGGKSPRIRIHLSDVNVNCCLLDKRAGNLKEPRGCHLQKFDAQEYGNFKFWGSYLRRNGLEEEQTNIRR